ncbi:MAG TPA: M15 family metallopeptidase, partial [Actinomycetes bacterium]|nr:M15 family metallopeptidase [Actinomycetes bacterium]
KVMWVDGHHARIEGGRAAVEVVDGVIYLAMSLRNVGSGMAVLHGWHSAPRGLHADEPHAEPEEFRTQTRDLYVPPGDVVTTAFAAIGWTWGGTWRSPRDLMHFSATGG